MMQDQRENRVLRKILAAAICLVARNFGAMAKNLAVQMHPSTPLHFNFSTFFTGIEIHVKMS
jgi:hypothetical protein